MAKLHPKMVAHAKAVKQAHAHLIKTQPGFSSLHPHARLKAVQAHVRRTKG